MKNPAALAKPPRRSRPALQVWSESETALFLSEAQRRSPHYPLYLFLVGTGVRIGEALGLTWQEVALGDGVVFVSQTLQRTPGGGYVLKDPKTQNSRRAITLPPEVAEELRRLRSREQEENAKRRREVCEDGSECRRQHCQRWHALDLVFCLPTGKPLHDNNIRQRDRYPLCRRLGLPWRRALHNMRHGHGSHLLERNVPLRTVSERLGHKDPAFTARVYSHVLRGQTQAAQATSEMLRGGG